MNKQDRNEKAETSKGDGDEKSRPEENDNSEPDTNANELTPVKRKTGEGPDNLKRRSEWFQKRHGRS